MPSCPQYAECVILLNAITPSVIILSVIILSVIIMSAIMPSAIIVNVIILRVIRLGLVASSRAILQSGIMLIRVTSVIRLNVVLLSVAAPVFRVYSSNCSCNWWKRLNIADLHQGILKGEGSLYHWLPVWLLWNRLYDHWQFLFLFAKQTNRNQSNRRSMVQWYFPF